MQLWSDDRAAAVQVGAIILFAFIILAITGYQATVVPSQNSEIEFNHNQRVQGQLADVEATIGSMPAVADRRTVTVDLSTSYPARTLFINPPRPTGRLSTVGTEDRRVAVEVRNATATNGDIADFWNGGTRNYSTGALLYRPNYNVYSEAPRTFVENSLVYNEFADSTLTTNSQSLFDGDDITLVAVRGTYAENGGTASVSVRPVSASSTTTTVTNSGGSENVTVKVVSRLSAKKWRSLLLDEGEFYNQSSGGHVAKVRQNGSVTIDGLSVNVIEFKMERGESYTLQLARVGVGELSAGERTTNASYALAVTESVTTEEDVNAKITVEVRDQYNNPKQGVEVNATVAPGGSAGGSIVDTKRTTDEDGRVTFTYEAPTDVDGTSSKSDSIRVSVSGDTTTGFDKSDPKNVTSTVTVKNTDGSGTRGGGGGGGGGGSVYTITFDKAPADTWDVTGEGSTLTYTARTGPESIEGVSTDFAVNNSSVASVQTESGDTGSNGAATVTLNANANGTVAVYVGSGGSSDVLNLTVENVPPGPTAKFTYTPSNPDSGESITFDASSSNGNGRSITSYEWDFDGDGNTDKTGETVTRSYSNDASYTVTLTVTDSDDNTDTKTKTVNVQNRGPTASFTYSPSEPKPGQSVNFDAGSTSDPDDPSSALSYSWEFGDGSRTSGKTPSHTYSSTGDYDVTLTVTDDDGATSTVTKTVTVSDPGLITAVGPNPNDGRSDKTEFVRVKFPSGTDTTGWTIVDGQGDTINVGQDYSGEVYFVNDKQAFLARWSVDASRVVEYGLGKNFLRNSGEALELRNSSGGTIDEFAYRSPGASNNRETSNNWHKVLGPGEVGKRTKTSGTYDDTDSAGDWTVLAESTFFNTRDINTPQGGVAYVDRVQTNSYSEYAVRTLDSQGRVALYPDANSKQPKGLGPARSDVDGDGYDEVVYVNGDSDLVVTDRRGEWQIVPTGGSVKSTSIGVNGDTIYYVSGNNGELEYVRNTSSGWTSPTVIKKKNGKNITAATVGGVADVDDDGTLEAVYVTANNGKLAHVDVTNGDQQDVGLSGGISIGSNNGYGIGDPTDFNGNGTPRIPIVTNNNRVYLVDATTESATSPNASYSQAAKAPLTGYDVNGDGTKELVFANTSDPVSMVAMNYLTGSVSTVTDQNGATIDVNVGNGEGVASVEPFSDLRVDREEFDVRRSFHRHVQIAAASSTGYDKRGYRRGRAVDG